MKRHIFTYLALLLLISLGCKEPNTEDKDALKESHTPALNFRPNILWLVAEDLSPVIPSFGDSTITTPTLSRLAAEGVRYTHVFSPSGVCSPSRAAIATGMYQNHIGAHHMRTGPWWIKHTEETAQAAVKQSAQFYPEGLVPYEAVPPAEVKIHSEYLRAEGYYCTNRAKQDFQFRESPTTWDESSPKAHWRNRKPGQPFFSIFNFEVTHESRIWVKAEDSLWVNENLEVPVPPYLPDNEIGQRDVRRMYSNIKEMDFQVGEILAQLEEDGLLDSTIVVWYTDHGGPLPRQKRLLYDSGMRLPMIIRFPNAWRAGEVDDQLISFVDFKPTLMSLVGIQPPAYVDGRAFLGDFAYSPKRRYVHGAADRFDERYDLIRAVRDQRFKYLRNLEPEKPYYLPVSYREQMPIMQELLRMRAAGELDEDQALWFRETKDKEELFDTENDPYELNNLAADPTYAEKLAELRDECDKWMTEIDDKGLISEKDFVESIWPGMVQPKTANPIAQKTESGISLICETEGASIGYQVLSEDEKMADSWKIYTEAINIKDGHRLIAIAHRLGYKTSDVVEVE